MTDKLKNIFAKLFSKKKKETEEYEFFDVSPEGEKNDDQKLDLAEEFSAEKLAPPDHPDVSAESLSQEKLPEKPKLLDRIQINIPKINLPSPKFSFKSWGEKTRKFTLPKKDSSKDNNAKEKGMAESQKEEKISGPKLSWNDLLIRFFSPYFRSKIHHTFIILATISLAYMLGKNAALLFSHFDLMKKPVAKMNNSEAPISIPEDTSSQEINRIASTNLFQIKESDRVEIKKKKVDIDKIICTNSNMPTVMQVKLVDTIVLQDTVKSVAAVQVRGREELMNLREGERIESMAEVSKIERMRVILKNLETGDCEYAKGVTEDDLPRTSMRVLPPTAMKSLMKNINPNIENQGNRFVIKKAYRDSMLSNMSELLTQARAIQITNPDGSLSFKMTEIVPGSLYTQLNIQENDIINTINGKKIESLNELTGLFGRIKQIDQFQLGVKRNGSDENYEYHFE